VANLQHNIRRNEACWIIYDERRPMMERQSDRMTIYMVVQLQTLSQDSNCSGCRFLYFFVYFFTYEEMDAGPDADQ